MRASISVALAVVLTVGTVAMAYLDLYLERRRASAQTRYFVEDVVTGERRPIPADWTAETIEALLRMDGMNGRPALRLCGPGVH